MKMENQTEFLKVEPVNISDVRDVLIFISKNRYKKFITCSIG